MITSVPEAFPAVLFSRSDRRVSEVGGGSSCVRSMVIAVPEAAPALPPMQVGGLLSSSESVKKGRSEV
eukprot:384028-Rhodomonas_salina.1